MKILKSILFTTALFVSACAELSLQERYQAAVKDAAFVKERENSRSLWAISLNNPKLIWNADKTKLLVVTWKKQGDYQQFIKNNTQTANNPDFALWVTAAPQVKAFCSNYAQQTPEQLNSRLKQYLGLAPDWQYDVFVELWVNPEDLFRPCVDPETKDKQCEIQVPKTFPAVANIPDYRQFYSNLYFKSFRASAGVPWSGLGYTFDWGNEQSNVGASEFILKPNSPYQIKQVLSTHDYCQTAR
jgi:hypothetical protein